VLEELDRAVFSSELDALRAQLEVVQECRAASTDPDERAAYDAEEALLQRSIRTRGR
jgi:hypothetical protein